jgi:hypothetical protein
MIRFRHWVATVAIGLLATIAHAEKSDPLIRRASPAFAARFFGWKIVFEAGTQTASPQRGVFDWHSTTREGNARLSNRRSPKNIVRLVEVAKRRCSSDRDSQDNSIDPKAQAEIKRILATSDLSKFIEGDLREKKLSYADLNDACVQEFEAALTRSNKQSIRTIVWHFIRETETKVARVDVWSIFVRNGDTFKPRYVARIFGEWGTTDLFEVLAVGDLNGDGVDEWIMREIEFEAEEDHLAIVSWEADSPVIVYDTDTPSPRSN